jgi:hypothetical protein
VLRVLASGAAYELWFHDGKIVEVRASLGKDAQEICARLVRSHELHEKVYDLVGKKKVSIAQLFDLLVSRNFAEPKQFHRAKRAHDLDLIHTIGLSADAVLEFQSQDVRPDPRFPVSLSPGQLLLDLCELQQDEEKFQSNFGGNQCGTTRVSRRTDEVKGLCDFEQAVWDMIEQSRQIGELFQTLLSEYEVKEGLLGLLEKSLLTVETEASLASRALVKEEDDFRLGEVEEEPDLWSKIADDAVGSMLKDFDDLLALREEVESPPTVREPEAPRSEPSEPEREQIPEVSAQDEMLEDESGVASPELESLCQELREAYSNCCE